MSAMMKSAAPSRMALRQSSKQSTKVALPAADSSFKVWQPVNNKQYETFSYLPPLTDNQIAKQVDYIINNGWTPCLEFADPATSFVDNGNCVRLHGTSAGYYDNRYWTMWKLPMFGCTDPSQVLKEVGACQNAFPRAYIRLVAFDNVKQVQCMGFLVQRPRDAVEYCPLDKRSV